jgi:hypothetical protein
MKKMIFTTAAVLAVLLVGATAQATDNTFSDAGSNDWNTPGNWSLGHVPTADENAVIPADNVCNIGITTAVADTIEVYGTLNIAAGAKLTLDGSESSTSYVSGAGKVYLLGSGSELSFTSNNHTVSHSGTPGEIIGCHINVKITITIVITIEIKITGSMEIQASGGTFVNDGIVEANRNGASDNMLTCYSGTFTGSGTYKVSVSGATLKFVLGITATGLATDFVVPAGTLDIDEDVTTSGDLNFTGGTINVAANKTLSIS